MAIVSTTHTKPAYGNRPAETFTIVEGEPAPPRNRPPASPEPAKFVELPLDELRTMLTEETAKLAGMDAEIKLITDRAAEVKIKLANAEESLVATLAQNKQTMADYARGKADDKAVTQGQADVRSLEDLIAGLKNVAGIVAADLEALKEPRRYQKERIVTSCHNRAWEAVAKLELESAKPFLRRAYCAGFQAGNLSHSNSVVTCPESVVKTVVAELVKEYNLPPR